ncbi:hypothetical protein ABFX02_10G079000 [Erythranthe guttata]
MLKARSWLAISSNTNLIRRFHNLGLFFMANFMLGQTDFQMLPLRRFNTATSPLIDITKRRLPPPNRFRFRGCCSDNHGNNFSSDRVSCNDVQKVRASPSWAPQLLRPSDEVFVNGGGAANRGNFAGGVDQSSPQKVMLAVDVDEVLGNFVSALNKFIADRYSQNHSVSEYHVYEFFKIWNCSRDEADVRVHEFFKTHYFKKGIHPLPGAQKAIQNLSKLYDLSIVTSRQNVIKDHTIEWIEKHYPGLFQEIHFGNHFALDGLSRSKSEICKLLGAKVLIDDNPRYAIECAEVGIKVLLFDYENSYPWCKTEHIPQHHSLITKVHSWEEVQHQLSLSAVS